MEDQAGQFTLVYSDNGGGLPVELDISSTKSFGLKLVSGLAKQLAGDFTYSLDDGISKFYITFKSTALREKR
jgi:two-component sensor histidine kinase